MSRFSARTLTAQPTIANWGKAAPTGIGVVGGYGVATGGSSSSISPSGVAYTLLTFTSDSNLVVSTAGLFDVLLVGAGGGGGQVASTTNNTGGGGGGAVVGLTSAGTILTIYLPAGTIAIDVGAGNGSGTSGHGDASYITGYIAAPGGGRGQGLYGDNDYNPADGNGGGTRNTEGKGAFIPLSYGQYSGGNSTGSGGGGAGGAGGSGDGTTGGTGGNGLDISTFITGSTYYAGAGGGGGATTTGGAAGNGGVAGKISGSGNAGVNYGAGGGGTRVASGGAGGGGAAGIVYVRFRI